MDVPCEDLICEAHCIRSPRTSIGLPFPSAANMCRKAVRMQSISRRAIRQEDGYRLLRVKSRVFGGADVESLDRALKLAPDRFLRSVMMNEQNMAERSRSSRRE